jgi:hypothetical protein
MNTVARSADSGVPNRHLNTAIGSEVGELHQLSHIGVGDDRPDRAKVARAAFRRVEGKSMGRCLQTGSGEAEKENGKKKELNRSWRSPRAWAWVKAENVRPNAAAPLRSWGHNNATTLHGSSLNQTLRAWLVPVPAGFSHAQTLAEGGWEIRGLF